MVTPARAGIQAGRPTNERSDVMNANLYALLRDHFLERADQPCILMPEGPVIPYETLDSTSARIAAALRKAGCEPGDRVAVQVEKCWEALALYLGCLRGGFVYLPLNTAYQKGELAYFFNDSEASVIVGRPESAATLSTLRPQARVLTLAPGAGTLLDAAEDQDSNFEPVHRAPDDLASILYTSGTTGRAKGAMLTHRNLASNALTLVDRWGFTHDDVLLHALPLYHVHGLFVACHCALLAGARMLWHAKFEAPKVVSSLAHATVMMGVPTFYSRLLAEERFDADACAGMRLFISGSAPLLPATFDDFAQRTGHTILERYGMTETGMNTSNPLSGERRCGSVGLPLPGINVRVVDAAGAVCPAGEVGAIEVKGPNVFAGYWRMPEKTREEFTADGFFRTGDVGEMAGDGYLTIVGRAKDLIITGGLNVYPKEIEEHIDALPGIVESAVIGVPDTDFGEAVTAVVVAETGAQTEAGVIAALKGEIAAFKVPKRVHFVDGLPRNAMGKVEKKALRTRYSAQ